MVSLFEKDALKCTPHARSNWNACLNRSSPLLPSNWNEFNREHIGRGMVLILVQGLHAHAKISCLSEGIPGLVCRGMSS